MLGNGGGSTDIRYTLSDVSTRLVVAGGGGGGSTLSGYGAAGGKLFILILSILYHTVLL